MTRGADDATVDAERLDEVLTNLLSNPILDVPSCGHVLLRLQLEPEVVEWTVADDCPKCYPASRPHSFAEIRREGEQPALGWVS